MKATKAGGDKAAIKTAVDALVAIKEKITALDPSHPLALVDKAAKKKAEKEAKKKQEAAAPAADGGAAPSKNAQKAAAKKALKDAKKKAHKEGAAAPAAAAPKAAAPKAAAPKPAKAPPKAADGAVAAALAAACSRTAAAPFSTANAYARSLAAGTGLCGSTPLERARVAMWMAWAARGAGGVDALEAALATRSYLAGERLTLADAACYAARGAQIAAAPSPAAARWLDQVQAECRALAPAAAWPAARELGLPRNAPGPLRLPARAAPAPAKGAALAAPAKGAAPTGAPADAPKKAKKEKKEKPKKAPAAPAAAGPASDGSPEGDCLASAPALDVRVGTVVKCWEHPEAEKLYCEEIDIGEEAGPRTIASGLRPFYASADDIRGRKVLIFANLKARTMQGFKSCGMVLCASNADHTVVKLLEVPAGAKNGDRVAFGDLPVVPPAAPSAVQKKKLLEKVIGFLKTDGDGVATVLGKKFALPAGPVTAPGMPDAAIS